MVPGADAYLLLQPRRVMADQDIMNPLLSGMKRLERNSVVLGQTVFLGEYLSRPPELFAVYGAQLPIGQLTRIRADDSAWLTREEITGTHQIWK